MNEESEQQKGRMERKRKEIRRRVIIREINVKNDDDMKKCRERGSYAARGKNRKGNGIDGP